MTIALIFPHQLFPDHPAIGSNTTVYLIEEALFFNQYKFHKQKIVLHKASMRAYAAELMSNGLTVHYVAADDKQSDVSTLFHHFVTEGVTTVHLCFTNDNWLQKRVEKSGQQNKLHLHWIEGPDFLTSTNEITTFFKGKKHYHQTDFYTYQRKRFDILVNEKKEPLGGKWSFDSDNRKKLPKGISIPPPLFPTPDQYLDHAIREVNLQYQNLPGTTTLSNGHFPWAWTRQQALANLNYFLQHKLVFFGDFEDAIAKEEHFIFHSLLSPSLNIGLITPKEVIDHTLEYASNNNIPLNALEGFIRQVIGWREFIRATYLLNGSYQRTRNFWGFKRKIPSSFYTGETGIVPIDQTIKKVLSTGYAHHIERLMILGNFFLLCEFDPDEVYKWFMELFIDAYDWVMVPNVYGMTQFADGGTLTTKPYISGSNYIFKMSDYKKEGDNNTNSWHFIWDSLFWHFMDKQRNFFLSNPRLGMLIHTYDKMAAEKKQAYSTCAIDYLKKLDSEGENVT